MKMKKKNIILIVVFAAFSVMIIPLSCSKNFLTTTNTFQTTADITFKKSSDVVSLVNSIYDTYQNSDMVKKTIWYWANFETHDFYNHGDDFMWNNYTITPGYAHLIDLWNNAYIAIARANSAFGVIQTAKEKGIVTPELATRLTGEVYFLRGMTYYYLAGCFGGVPLELSAVTNGLNPRSSRDSVFNQVVRDMDTAASMLPWKEDYDISDLGRATKGAALGFAGAARMWVKDYAGALANFNALDGKYHLLPNYGDIQEFDHQNNDECLFSIQFDLPAGGSQSWDGSWQTPGGEIAWMDAFDWPAEVTAEGYDYANPALWLSFQHGDQRKYHTILGPGDTIQSAGIIAGLGGIKGYAAVQGGYASWVTSLQNHISNPGLNPTVDTINADRYAVNTNNYTQPGQPINSNGTITHPWYGVTEFDRTGYTCSKNWTDPSLSGSNSTPNGGPQNIFGSRNQILLRYAEILLDRAECKIHTGDEAGALLDIQQVRDRAFGGTAPAMQDSANFDGTPGQPITDPMQMVLSEYRHELTGEYSTFFDLCRAGSDLAVAFVNAANGGSNSTTPVKNPAPMPSNDGKVHGLYNTAISATHLILPIPQVAIGLNPSLTQNPGY
jgi:starch-binding outer membrane protein, SusD/RagB family